MMPDLPIQLKKPMYYGAVYVLLAVMVGVAAAYQPMFSILGLGVIFLIMYAICQPEKMSYLVLLSTAISINYIVEANVPGLEIISLYKLGILILLVPSMLQNGLRLKFIYPIAAIASMLFLTLFFSEWHPRLTLSLTLKAFIGLTLPFFFLMIKWNKGTAQRHIRIICLLPLVSVGTGALLQLAHLYSFLNVEFTGAIRVQGANIAPHLAMLAFLGITVALIETKRNPLQARFFYCTLAANFAILIATGTRGPILAMLAMAAYYFYDMVKQYIKGKLILIIPLLCSLVLIGGAVYVQWDNMTKRSFERQTGTGIDLSGRTEAWSYFLKGVKDSPLTGRGLGAVTVANDGSLYEGFVVPHNEYIRFYYDAGYIGCSLLFLSLLVLFGMIYRVIPQRIKIYYMAFILAFFLYSLSDNTLSTVQFIIPFCWYLNSLYILSTTNSKKEEVI
ncbi:O-antigen ligase family protein [Paenibacillus alginolyticus]|uniref:O-antigen ligase family protein n=1 Tax=Paenibacillus alginolyticus TaxID=59839 RepID=A0ABT4GKR8_9BACL|nr:O-antigen ligase family protein [Paenibacillus alginolyticus]MCY9696791.1 O-antigen ligase family protein [Paenibacillus alginolyticus]MEC0147695.1 O-antigen ligase family protein [Paenibacillus alginolyticus]